MSRPIVSTQETDGLRSQMLSDTTKDFSLMLGGPLYQFFLRVGLVKPPLDRVAWRVIVISMTAWMPLLVLSALNGRLVGGVKIPFLYDFEVQARLMAALPLLIGAEATVSHRFRIMLRQFVDRQIITSNLLSNFEQIGESALRLRNSAAIELGVLVFVFTAGILWWRGILVIQTDTWYATATGGGTVLTPAGYWYQFVSIPIIQFIALRWYFRLLIWARMLWQVSRLDLNLVPTHPDRCCGLGFLGGVAAAMGPFLMAHSVLLSGFLADRILYQGGRLPDFVAEIVVVAILMYIIVLGPLCVFNPRLLRRRREGLCVYGVLASEYVIAFQNKWVEGRRQGDESLLGSSDIQSLADLANSFEVVQNIQPFPFGRRAIVAVAINVALPILPLTLTMFSLQELVSRLVKVLL
jgi:hypothetical protein